MTVKELQHLQYLLKLFIELECPNYIDIDDLELVYTLNRIYNIIKDKELDQ